MNTNVQFGEQLKECREIVEPKVTQSAIADAIGVDHSRISQWESGNGLPDLNKLDGIVRLLRNRGVPEECLYKLKQLSGLMPRVVTHSTLATLEQVINTLSRLNPSAKVLLEDILRLLLEDWEKYRYALSDLRTTQWDDSQVGFERLLETLSQEMPFRQRLSIRVLQGLADACRYSGKPLVGLDHLNTAIGLVSKMENEQKTLAELLLQRGNFHRRSNEFDKARSDYIQSDKLFKEFELASNEKQDIFIAHVERKLAGTYLFQGRPIRALTHCERSLSICRQIGDIDAELKGLQHKAWAYAMLGYWDKSLATHTKVLTTLSDNKETSPLLLAKGYRYLADLYRMCGLWVKADQTYEKAEKHLDEFFDGESDKERLVRGVILLGKGAVYRLNPMTQRKAKSTLEDSLKIHVELGAKFHEGQTHNHLGRLALDLKDFHRASLEFNKAKKIYEDLDNDYYKTAMFLNIGELQYLQGDLPEARASFTNALESAEKGNFQVHHIRACLKMAKVNQDTPDMQKPAELYLKALHVARTLNIYLSHEVLCWISNEPHQVTNDDSLKRNIIRLCVKLREERGKSTNNISATDALINDEWIAELSQLESLFNEEAQKNSSIVQ